MIKGVLFDFNGTLFFDTELHIISWREYAKTKFNKIIDDDTFIKHFHGRSNDYIIPFLTDNKITDKETINKCVLEKCDIYQNLVKNMTTKAKLVDGTIELFKFLQKHNIPFNICTASRKINVDFYYEIFTELNSFVPRNKIVFDDLKSIIHGKPSPDFYLKGAKSINRDIKDCIVIEDSYSGLLSGLNSNCYKTIAVRNGTNNEEISQLNIDTTINNMFELIEYIKKENNIKD